MRATQCAIVDFLFKLAVKLWLVQIKNVLIHILSSIFFFKLCLAYLYDSIQSSTLVEKIKAVSQT